MLISIETATLGASGPNATTAVSPGQVKSFESMMSAAVGRHEGPSMSQGVLRLPANAPATSEPRVSPIERAMHNFSVQINDRYASLSKEIMDIGKGVDLSKHESAVLLLERQASITNANMEFHVVLQTADNVKHAVKTLFQSNG